MKNNVKVFNYLDEYSYLDREVLINNLVEIFEYTRDKAMEIYYRWKHKFMKLTNCIPEDKEPLIYQNTKLKRKGNMIYGEYGKYIISEYGSIMVSPEGSVLDLFFNDIEEVKRYIYYRYCNRLKDIDNSLYETIEVFKLINKGVR